MGWSLLGLAAAGVTGVVVAGALTADGGEEFNRWVGWAGVGALVLATLALVPVVWEKIASGSAGPAVDDAETELAAIVLAQGRDLRARLLGTDEIGDVAANVTFVRGAGRFREVGGERQGGLSSVLEYYRSLSPARLAVLGDAGAGKTVLVLELMIRLLEERAARDEKGPVPVLISAAAWDVDQPWENWLTSHLARRFGKYGIHRSAVARLVRDRRILPLVDGLDEMDPAGRPERLRSAVAALNAYMAGRERAAVVVTCRPTEYRALTAGLDRATHVEMEPLTGTEAAEYLRGQMRDERELRRWEPVLDELSADPEGQVAGQLETPWRLTLALTVFRDGGAPAELLPDPDPAGYAERVNALLLDRYVPAAVRLHAPEGGYTPQQVRRWLTALAAALAVQSDRGGSVTDIELPNLWRIVGRWSTSLAHMALACAPAAIWTAVVAVVRPDEFFLLLACGFLWFVGVSAGRPPVYHRLRAYWLTAHAGRHQFAVALALWLLFCGWVILPVKGGFALWLAYNLTGAFTFWIAVEGDAWARYHVAVAVAASRGTGPLRFKAFMDWGCRAGLLRLSGDAYQFRHRQLQDRLTSHPRAGRPHPAAEPENGNRDLPLEH